jgi:hypothetical protein
MKFSLASQRSNNAPPMKHGRKEAIHGRDQQGITFNAGLVKLNHSPISDNATTGAGKFKWASIAWATASIAWAIAVSSIVWAVFVYLMEREKRWAQVELARLEMEGKKQIPSN